MRRPLALLLALMFVVVPAGATRAFAGSSKPVGLVSATFVATGASQALGKAGVKMRYQQQASDEAAARITIYVPRGYQVSTGRSVGTPLGTAAATLFAADRNAVIPVTGTVEVAAPSNFAARSEACTQTTNHDEVWALRLEPAGTRLVVPVFVDRITAEPLATVAAAQIVVCLEPGEPRLLLAEFTSNAIGNPAVRGEYRWRATVTPYRPATGMPDDVGTVELQSIVALPTAVSLRARAAGKGPKAGLQAVAYSGTLAANSRGLGDAVVELFRGAAAGAAKKFRSQATNVAGSFRGAFTVAQARKPGSLVLLATAVVRERDLGAAGCTATFEAIPCRRATVGAFSVTSRIVAVPIQAAPRKTGK